MSDSMAMRRSVFDGMTPIRVEGKVTAASLPFAARFVFRGDAKAAAACGKAFGVTLPKTLLQAASEDGRSALSLGPDEWLLIARDGEEAGIAAKIEKALAKIPHALVDVSHRNTAFTVTGAQAEALLASGCPLDLHETAFPVGMATRTLFAKADVILWRTGTNAFRVELWRSFVPFVWGILAEASREL